MSQSTRARSCEVGGESRSRAVPGAVLDLPSNLRLLARGLTRARRDLHRARAGGRSDVLRTPSEPAMDASSRRRPVPQEGRYRRSLSSAALGLHRRRQVVCSASIEPSASQGCAAAYDRARRPVQTKRSLLSRSGPSTTKGGHAPGAGIRRRSGRSGREARLAMHVLDFDFDTAIGDVGVFDAVGGMDHSRRELHQFTRTTVASSGSLGNGMQRSSTRGRCTDHHRRGRKPRVRSSRGRPLTRPPQHDRRVSSAAIAFGDGGSRTCDVRMGLLATRRRRWMSRRERRDGTHRVRNVHLVLLGAANEVENRLQAA